MFKVGSLKHAVWTVNDVLVDPYPFYCIKRLWIDQNKKVYGSTKTSLTVHAVYYWSYLYLLRFFDWSLKGQTKSKRFFQADVSSKKFYFTTMKSQVDLFSFLFWRKLKTPKRHFEINWPLARGKLFSSYTT